MSESESLTTRILQPHPDLTLSIREGGSGSPLLVLHGGAGPDSVTPIAERYIDTYRVILPTHPGWNDTPRPDWLASVHSLATVYLDLLKTQLGFADAPDQGSATVVGSSFGGWVASEMATLSTNGRISRLVLIDAIGPAIPGHAPAIPVPQAPAAGDVAKPSRGPSQSSWTALRAYAGPDMHDPGLLPRLASVSIPTLVVWGQHDLVLPPAYGRAYAAAFPDSQFEIIPGGGHIPTREAPDATFAAIDTFLT
jgi:pimeloyl-ACP methyl ester carboxylesterase